MLICIAAFKVEIH